MTLLDSFLRLERPWKSKDEESVDSSDDEAHDRQLGLCGEWIRHRYIVSSMLWVLA